MLKLIILYVFLVPSKRSLAISSRDNDSSESNCATNADLIAKACCSTSLCAPPSGSEMTSSIIPNCLISWAVFYRLNAL